MPQGPWEKFQDNQPSEPNAPNGPWLKFQNQSPAIEKPTVDNRPGVPAPATPDMHEVPSTIPQLLNAGLDKGTQGDGVVSNLANTAVGAIKGAEEAAHTVGSMIPGSGVPFQEPDYLAAKNTSQGVGKGLEGLVEMVSGDAALKGLTSGQKLKMLADVVEKAESHPWMMKLISKGIQGLRNDALLASSVRQGGEAAAQSKLHGADNADAAEAGVGAGGVSLGLGVLGKAGSAMKSVLGRDIEAEAAAQTESLQNAANAKFEADEIAAQAKLEKGATNLSTKLSGGPTPDQPSIVNSVQKHIELAHDAMEDTYNLGMSRVHDAVEKAGGIDVPIKGSPLEATATEILHSGSKVPEELVDSLKKLTPGSEKLDPLLQQFAGEGGEISADAVPPRDSYSWDEMEATRIRLGRAIRKQPIDSPIKPEMIQLRSAIDQTMQKAAADAGRPEISTAIKGVRNQYATTINQLSNDGVRALRESNPDSVAKILLNKTNSVERAEDLRSLIGPKMKAVEGGMFQTILDRSMNADGELVPQRITTQWSRVPPEVKRAVWGDRVQEIDDFMKTITKRPTSAPTVPAVQPKGVGAKQIAERVGTGLGLAYGAYKFMDDPKEGALIMIGSGLGALRIPARMLANPKVLGAVAALAKNVGSPKARAAAVAATSQLLRMDNKDSATHYYNPDSGKAEPLE